MDRRSEYLEVHIREAIRHGRPKVVNFYHTRHGHIVSVDSYLCTPAGHIQAVPENQYPDTGYLVPLGPGAEVLPGIQNTQTEHAA